MGFATGSVSGAHFYTTITMGNLIVRNRGGIYFPCRRFSAFYAGIMYYGILDANFALGPGKGFVNFDALMSEALFTTALVCPVLSVGCVWSVRATSTTSSRPASRSWQPLLLSALV